jgi:hypothetical protein
VRQRVAHVPGVAVDDVVLAAVRFVGDHDDVAALRERRVPACLALPDRQAGGRQVAPLLREELVDGREDQAAGCHREQLAQVRAARLHRRLGQQLLAAREGAEGLVVEIVAVGEHDEGRVAHRRLAHDAPGVEGHRQALARALRVPHDAHAPVAGPAAGLAPRLVAPAALGHVIRACQLRGPKRFVHVHLHGVELVVAGHLLDDAPA